VSTFALGRDVEELAARELRQMGYVVHLAGHAADRDTDGNRIPYGRDLFGLFDLLALGAYDAKLVQVKATAGTRPDPKWRRAVELLPHPALPRYEFWTLEGDGPTWTCFTFTHGGEWDSFILGPNKWRQ